MGICSSLGHAAVPTRPGDPGDPPKPQLQAAPKGKLEQLGSDTLAVALFANGSSGNSCLLVKSSEEGAQVCKPSEFG